MMLYGPLLVWLLISAFGPYDVVQGPSSKLLYVHESRSVSKSKLRSKIYNLRKKNSYKKFNLYPDRIYQFLKKKKLISKM